ncbi:hypothetical protein BCU68_00360 [Vibrio sp. 10N.286.49.B3]|uniref:DUF3305 domain-containing protein n=1 Tax=Vibrio sp. 10N.286.49.B3 TaxID=1880855 RepID=UPI000C815996|nr:DUF3305 domain-containing protein [Vibrio sp. 10N.286.49.B3]PMH46538.1 hypothetical protein BCU68_00360 [Vibrio sp. 10N.286.49.B3]
MEDSHTEPSLAHVIKTEDRWSIECHLELQEMAGKFWQTWQWNLLGFDLHPQQVNTNVSVLQLYRDERTDYRFNLSSTQPKLFVVLDNHQDSDVLNIVMLTAAQSVAGRYMDTDYTVLSFDMPLAVQAWMEAFIGRHGELLEIRRKKRKGAGRSSEK